MTDAIADGPRILVVEDDPRTAELLRHILEVDGYRVLHARDSAHALTLTRRSPGVDVALVDLELIDDDMLERAESDGLCIMVVQRPMNLDRMREVLHRVHQWAPFPPESRSATSATA